MECKILNYLNRYSIAKRFFIISVFILLIVLLITNIVIIRNFKKVIIDKEKRLINKWIETSLREHLRFFIYKKEWNKKIDFTPLVNELKKFPDVVNITFYSKDGEMLYTVKKEIEKKQCFFKKSLNMALNGKFLGRFYKFYDPRKRKEITLQIFFYPFIFKNNIKGIIQICMNAESLLNEINMVRLSVLSISFFGYLLYILIVYFIITTIENREKKLQEEIEKYQRLSCLGNFSAKMSHELGTPLHVIQGNVELIDENVKDKFVKERIDVINRQINKINNIIKNYLYLAKEPVPEMEYFKLKEFLLRIIDEFTFTIPENITIKTEIEDYTVYSDKDFIEQILYNFVKNSVDSIGEKKGEILIKAYRKDDFLYIEVIDNGKGFPEKIKKQLFDPFFTTKKTGKGTGLGLSVCKDLITSLKGEIYCDSKDGKTVFGIKIPLIN